MPNRIAHCCLSVLITALAVACPRAQAQDETISLPAVTPAGAAPLDALRKSIGSNTLDFAFNETTGELAALCAVQNRLTVYPADYFVAGSTAESRSVGTPQESVAVIYKRWGSRTFYVVLCISDLVVFDATSLEEVHRGKLPVRRMRLMRTANDPEDPYVYYSHGLGGTEVRRIDARTWEDVGQIPGKLLLGVSGDGTHVCVIDEYLRSVEISGEEATPSKSFRRGGKPYADDWPEDEGVGDPHSGYFFHRRRAFRADLMEKFDRLPFEVVSVASQRPWVAGLRAETTLVIARYGTFEPVAEYQLPKSGRPDAVKAGRFGARPARRRFFFDAARQRLLIGLYDHVTVVPLKTLDLPQNEVVPRQLPFEFTADGSDVLAIPTRDPEVVVTPHSDPPGGEQQTGALRWDLPDRAGQFRLVADLSRGQARSVETVIVNLNRPYLEVPVPAPQIFTDPTGRYTAFVDVGGGFTTFAVFDWQTQTMSPKKQVSTTDTIRLTAESLMLMERKRTGYTDAFRLPLPDLEPVTNFRTEWPIGNQWIAAFGQDGVFRKLPSGEPKPFPPLVEGLFEQSRDGQLVDYPAAAFGAALGDGWVSEGVFYPDDALENPALLLRPWGFLRSSPLDVQALLEAAEYQPARNATVGRLLQISENRESAFSDSIRFKWKRGLQANTLSMEILETEQQQSSRPVRQTVTVGLFDGRPYDSAVPFAANGKLAVVSNGRLYQFDEKEVPPPEEIAVPPLRFQLRQSHLVAKPNGVTEFRHELEGAQGEVRYEVQGPTVGEEVFPLTITPDGVVPVDAAKVIDFALPHFIAQWEDQSESILDDYQKNGSKSV